MAPPNSAASKKAAKAGAKKIPIEKPGIKKTAKKVVLKAPAASAKTSKTASLKAQKSPAMKTLKSPAMKTLKTPAVKSKKSPAAVKKASPLKKIGDKAIKKTTKGGKEGCNCKGCKEGKGCNCKGCEGCKGGLDGAKDNLEGGAKASAAFDLEAFVKVKFSELEKTAHQKKVSQILLSQLFNSMFQNVSGQTNSTVAELSKFNMRAANEHYKVKKEDSLEAILLALHLPGDKVAFHLS